MTKTKKNGTTKRKGNLRAKGIANDALFLDGLKQQVTAEGTKNPHSKVIDVTVVSVADRVKMPRPTASNVAKRLSAKGIITRTIRGGDAHVSFIRVKPAPADSLPGTLLITRDNGKEVSRFPPKHEKPMEKVPSESVLFDVRSILERADLYGEGRVKVALALIHAHLEK